jgi:hypothetical protein
MLRSSYNGRNPAYEVSASPALGFFYLPAVLISFAARGFQVESQVFHIQPKLTEGILDKGKDSTPTAGAVDYSGKIWIDLLPAVIWQKVYRIGQV